VLNYSLRPPSRDFPPYLIVFKLVTYEFTDYCTYVTLNISIKNEVAFDNTYQANGKWQQAKMWMGGVFLMRNAIRKSTKYAIDSIVSDFVNDINSKSFCISKP
jgi:hypothetical protein